MTDEELYQHHLSALSEIQRLKQALAEKDIEIADMKRALENMYWIAHCDICLYKSKCNNIANCATTFIDQARTEIEKERL